MPTNKEIVDFLRSEADAAEPKDGGFGMVPLIREGFIDIRYRSSMEMRALADRIEADPAYQPQADWQSGKHRWS